MCCCSGLSARCPLQRMPHGWHTAPRTSVGGLREVGCQSGQGRGRNRFGWRGAASDPPTNSCFIPFAMGKSLPLTASEFWALRPFRGQSCQDYPRGTLSPPPSETEPTPSYLVPFLVTCPTLSWSWPATGARRLAAGACKKTTGSGRKQAP